MNETKTQMSAGKLLKTWYPAILLFAWFALSFSSAPLLANEEIERQMRDLVKTGPVPDAIINPPQQVTYTLSVSERLNRFWREEIMGFRITYASARGKACHANQRAIAGAIEIYNMDHANSMTNLLHSDVADPSGALVGGFYLKSQISLPEVNCEYHSYGNLTDKGIIYCLQHGTTPGNQTAIFEVTGLKPRSASRKADIGFVVAGLTILFFLTALVLLALHFKKPGPAEGEQLTKH